jgi:hypothetical protein
LNLLGEWHSRAERFQNMTYHKENSSESPW